MTPPGCMPDGSGGSCATSPLAPAVSDDVEESRFVEETPRGGSTICVTLPAASAESSKNIMAGGTRPWLQPGLASSILAGRPLDSGAPLHPAPASAGTQVPRCDSYTHDNCRLEGRARSRRVASILSEAPEGIPLSTTSWQDGRSTTIQQHDDTRTIGRLQCVIFNLLPRRINETTYSSMSGSTETART